MAGRHLCLSGAAEGECGPSGEEPLSAWFLCSMIYSFTPHVFGDGLWASTCADMCHVTTRCGFTLEEVAESRVWRREGWMVQKINVGYNIGAQT